MTLELLPLPIELPEAPHIVIDDRGYEVGAIVHYAEYVMLLDMLATYLDRDALSSYWRNALEACLAVEAG